MQTNQDRPSQYRGLFNSTCRCGHSILNHETGGRCEDPSGCRCQVYHEQDSMDEQVDAWGDKQGSPKYAVRAVARRSGVRIRECGCPLNGEHWVDCSARRPAPEPIEIDAQGLTFLPESDQLEGSAATIRRLLVGLGLDVDTEELRDTPMRVARMYQEFCQPYDLLAILKSGFENMSTDGGLITQEHIPFRSLCPHHLLPFVGEAYIGYIPHRRMVGLSKLARLVDAAGTRRPCTQEEITNVVADTLHKGMDCQGVAVITEATHMCMVSRGVRAVGTKTKVSAIRGAFVHSPQARAEFFALIGR
jgi:GTP cyclohydrolase IA